MAAAFSLGQYVSKASIVHRLDARAKIVLVVAYAVALFLAAGWLGVGVCGALLVAGYGAARIPFGLALRGLKPILYILAFTIVVNSFTFSANDASNTSGGTIALIGSFGISAHGAATGLFFALRIALFVAATSLLTYTSTLVDIVDAIRSLASPLARFNAPVEDIAIVCALTLRFVPSTVEEAERVTKAQQARGLLLDEGGLVKRAKAWIPVIVPLFISLFRRAETLACAMDARCYAGGARTHLRSTRIRRADSVAASLGVVLLACVAAFL